MTAADAFGLRKESSEPRMEPIQVQGSSEEPNPYEPQRLENVDMSIHPHCKHTAEIVWLGILIDSLSIQADLSLTPANAQCLGHSPRDAVPVSEQQVEVGNSQTQLLNSWSHRSHVGDSPVHSCIK